jgi:tetratricopeptide (TPR) repeat protein
MVSPIELARFKRLAVRSSDVWQGGIVRLPAWVSENDDDPPYRARGVFWFSTRTGLVWPSPESVRDTPDVDLALRGLMDFAKKYDRELLGRPSRIEVTDAALADSLRSALSDPDTTIAVVAELPNVREAMQAFAKYQTDEEEMPPALLDAPGVTLDGLRGFADAAARFYDANVWNALASEEDLVSIEQPQIDASLHHLIVTGSAPDLRGLMFFYSRQQYERFLANPPRSARQRPRVWMISFDPIHSMPFGDVDAWTDHNLPVAAPDAYPRPGIAEPDGGLTRPDGDQLAFLEAVLRALAGSTEDDFDSGRWTRRVDTSRGPVEVRLALPVLLDAIARESASGKADRPSVLQTEQVMRTLRKAIEASGARSEEEAQGVVKSFMDGTVSSTGAAEQFTPLEQAQQLAYSAMEVSGRRQIALARRAIGISRDCADAWAILANRAPTATVAVPLYLEAVAAGERALGPEFFETEVGNFWGMLETRPYMRARMSLADALWGEGDVIEAEAHYRELLRLNPGDNQGVRYQLLALLIEEGKDIDARALLQQFDEESATWLYAKALVAFRLGEAADDQLDRALAANRHVAPFLTGEKETSELPPYYSPGSVEEAVITADYFIDAWNETPDATFWLNTRRRLLKPSVGKRTQKDRRK